MIPHLLLPLVLATATVTAPAPALPGRVGGPGQAIERVEAHAKNVFYIDFRGGELAVVTVVGDGDTDLDLFVYDENNNLVVSDIGPTDRCVTAWTPRWTGMFRVEVRNRGSLFNRFRLATN